MKSKSKINTAGPFFLAWLIFIVIFSSTIVIVTNFFSQSVEPENILATTLIRWSFILGVVSFILGIIFSVIKIRKLNKRLIYLLSIIGLIIYLAVGIKNLTESVNVPLPIFEPRFQVSADEVFNLSNQERIKVGLKELRRNLKLEEAALLRAQNIIEYQDWSHEAPKSGLSYLKALTKSKYYNIEKGENLAQGQRTSVEVVNGWMGSEGHRKNILDPDYQEMGVATFSGKLFGQETIVTVQIFGGYVPPNYKITDIESWEKSLSSLKSILPSWENLRTSPNLYPNNKDKVERIIQIINIRISHITAIVTRMKANQWLTKEEQGFIDQEESLYNEQQQLADYLNSQNW